MVEFLILRDPPVEAIEYLRPRYEEVHFADGMPTKWNYQGEKALVVITDTGGSGETQIINDNAQLTFEVIHRDKDTASYMARHIHGMLRLWPDLGEGVVDVTTNRRPISYPMADDPSIPTYMFILTVKFRAEKIPL